MRKRTIFLFVLLALALLFMLVACTKDDCEKLGHDWGEQCIELAATCATEGKYSVTCNRCGTTKENTIPATGKHDYGNLHEAVVPACLKDGNLAYYQCADCGQYFDAQYSWIGDDADDVAIPATGMHSFEAGEITKQPTCTEKGSQIYECAVCHTQESRTLDEIDHDYGVLHDAVEPTCVNDGNVAYYRCSTCKHYFDSDKSPIDGVTRPATGVHSWNTSSDVRWIWADTYAEFLVNGVKVELKCADCDAKIQYAATPIKDDARSVEPTYVEQGSYVFTAEVTVGGVTLTDSAGHEYSDVPVLPDGRPNEDYLLVGDFDGGTRDDSSKLMSWNVAEQAFEIKQSFAASNSWKIKASGALESSFDGNDLGVVSYDEGIGAPPDSLFTVLPDGSIQMEYDCVLLIKLDWNTAKINVFVKEIHEREAEDEFWLVFDDNNAHKCTKQDETTFALTVEVDEGASFTFKYNDVVLIYSDFDDVIVVNEVDEYASVLGRPDGYFMMMGRGATLHIIYDLATNVITIIIE